MGWPFPTSNSNYVFYTLECSVKEANLVKVLKKLGCRDYKLSCLRKNADGFAFRIETDIGGTLTQIKKFILPLLQRVLIEKAELVEISHRSYGDGSSGNTRGRTIQIK